MKERHHTHTDKVGREGWKKRGGAVTGGSERRKIKCERRKGRNGAEQEKREDGNWRGGKVDREYDLERQTGSRRDKGVRGKEGTGNDVTGECEGKRSTCRLANRVSVVT